MDENEGSPFTFIDTAPNVRMRIREVLSTNAAAQVKPG